ncbi:hypothetical protein ACS0TY_015057 [Phlomoides rotata]
MNGERHDSVLQLGVIILFLKISINRPICLDTLKMGIWMIIHDDSGVFVSCRLVVILGVFRVDEGKVMGLLEALSWIKHLSL